MAFLRQFFRRELPTGVVDGVGLGQDQLGDGHHSVAIVDEAGEDGGQRLRCMQRGVVEQHDAAGLDLGGHALADGVRVVVLPIQRVHIPLDGLHTHSTDGGNDVVIILAVGAADQRGRHAGDGADALIAGGDVRRDLLCRQAVVVVVVVGVTHHLVPCIVQRLHRLRVLFRPVAHHEECGFDMVLLQNVDEGLGILVAPR